PPRWTHRLYGRTDFDRHAADQGGHRESLCNIWPQPGAGTRQPPDRRGTRRQESRLRGLGLVLVPQGHAEGDRGPSCEGVERRMRHARGDRALQGHRRRRCRQGPAVARISHAIRQIRDRTLGQADQGKLRRSRLNRPNQEQFMKSKLALAAAAALLALTAAAPAQEWPTRPITLIVPFAPGGGIDASARLQALMMGEALGQTIVIENVGAAAGTVGSGRVAKAAPDGYTF